MAKTVSVLPKPELIINKFIDNELQKYDPPESVGLSNSMTFRPFFPATVINQQDFWTNYTGSNLVVGYDKMLRYRTNPFYRIKKEQLLLTVWTAEDTVDYDIASNVLTIITELLDREDEAGRAINKWAAENANDLDIPHNVFFHKIRVFKIDESRDLTELTSTNNDWMGNKIIVEYDYHVSDKPNYASGSNPEYDEDYK